MNLINKLRSWALPFFVGLIYLFLYIPVIVLIVFSFNKSASAYSWTGFTWDWYGRLFANKEIWLSLLNSLIVGGSAVILSIVMATLLVWGFYFKHEKWIKTFYAIMMVPDIVIAVGLLIFFTFFSVPFGLTTLIAGHTLLGLGLAVPIIYSRFKDLDYQIVEASLNLGASHWQTFIKVILPFLHSALISCGVSVFILSFDDFLISFFCAGSTTQTLSLYIFAVIKAGVVPIVNALSALILFICAFFVILFSVLKINTSRPKL